jgi:hypothetical protein
MCQCAPLGEVAESGNFTATVSEKAQGFWSEARWRGVKVSMPMMLIGSLRLWHHNDVGLLTLYYAANRCGEVIIIRCI